MESSPSLVRKTADQNSCDVHLSQNHNSSHPSFSQESPLEGDSSVPALQVFSRQAEMNSVPGGGLGCMHKQFDSLEISAGSEGATKSNEKADDTSQGESRGNISIKLFVGQVPKTMNEDDIFPTFAPFGLVKDVSIIRDKHTGIHRGCAFVTFWSPADAETAQAALHDKFTFPGGRRPAQVRPAEPPVPENKLFVGMLSRKAGEAEVRELFAQFGEIQEIYMIRNTDGSSKCAAFLRFVNRESALRAIEKMHNVVVMQGSARPLIVKFADTKQQRHARHIRNTRREQLHANMGSAGLPFSGFQLHHIPQVPHPLGIPPDAHPYTLPQYPAPFHAAASNPTIPPQHAYVYAPRHYGQPSAFAFQSNHDLRGAARPREGPAGANLFVYHLPQDLTDLGLATAFEPFGNVVSAKVYVDKSTGESKGFGFVSYDSVLSAESAIEQMNGFQMGNKRLKVQHKRVNTSNTGPSLMSSSQSSSAIK